MLGIWSKLSWVKLNNHRLQSSWKDFTQASWTWLFFCTNHFAFSLFPLHLACFCQQNYLWVCVTLKRVLSLLLTWSPMLQISSAAPYDEEICNCWRGILPWWHHLKNSSLPWIPSEQHFATHHPMRLMSAAQREKRTVSLSRDSKYVYCLWARDFVQRRLSLDLQGTGLKRAWNLLSSYISL